MYRYLVTKLFGVPTKNSLADATANSFCSDRPAYVTAPYNIAPRTTIADGVAYRGLG